MSKILERLLPPQPGIGPSMVRRWFMLSRMHTDRNRSKMKDFISRQSVKSRRWAMLRDKPNQRSGTKSTRNDPIDRKSHIIRGKLPMLISSFFIGVATLVGIKWIPEADMKAGRDNNNFIADVVDRSAKAVVMVELLSRNFFSGSMAPQSNGSGFIISEDGLIVTSAHVVVAGQKSGFSVIVKLYDNTTYTGTIESIDMKTDLATLRIKPNQRLAVLPLGTAKDVRPGEWVVAIGSPLALANTITAGVISTTHRHSHELKLVGKEDMSYIQTDASLTFGNSGGPLLNLDGEVIGVNAMKVTAGISFAVPISHVRELLARAKNVSKSANPKRFMGVTMLTLNPHIIHELKHQHRFLHHRLHGGVLIWRVLEGSPAQHAGLIPGDIAVELNGKTIHNSNTIYDALEGDEHLVLKVIRHGESHNVVVNPTTFDL